MDGSGIVNMGDERKGNERVDVFSVYRSTAASHGSRHSAADNGPLKGACVFASPEIVDWCVADETCPPRQL